MSTTDDAFDRAAGRPAGADVPDDRLAWARRILDLRREGVAEVPCPPGVLARARALLAQEAERGRSLLARLLFDTAAEPAPATRGAATARLLRFGREDVALDLEIDAPRGGLRVVRLAGSGLEAGGEAWIVVPEADEPIIVPLDAAGLGRAEVPEDASAVTVHLFAGRDEVLRTPAVGLGTAG